MGVLRLFVAAFVLTGSNSFAAKLATDQAPSLPPVVQELRDFQWTRLWEQGNQIHSKHYHPELRPTDIERTLRSTNEPHLLTESPDDLISIGTPINPGFCGSGFPKMPLEVVFSDYTVLTNGSIVQDGGWSDPEVAQLTSFLCKMLPILEQLYGKPYSDNMIVNYVKDLRYSNTNVFLQNQNTNTYSIHSAGGWHPQLITHEFLHAFRGPRIISMDPSVYWNYSSKMNGYEEGFAQAVSYEAMNRYLKVHGTDNSLIPFAHWSSDNNFNYEFRNSDPIYAAEGFFSDTGGTLIYWARYEQAAAAIRKLGIVIPNFYRRFNLKYYKKVDDMLAIDPLYKPTTALMKEIISELSATIAGQESADWLDRHSILKCEYQPGKKIWAEWSQPYLTDPIYRLHHVETFPKGSEWSHYVEEYGDYIYHRLNSSEGKMSVYKVWSGERYSGPHAVKMQPPSWWPDEASGPCGLEDSCPYSIAMSILKPYYGANEPVTTAVDEPIHVPQPTSEPGLYQFTFGYKNPHFSDSPDWEIPYDSSQDPENLAAIHRRYQILGLTPAEFQMEIVGGIVNSGPTGAGTLTVSHSEFESTLGPIPVLNGIFYANAPSDWKTPIIEGKNLFESIKPGVLTFVYQEDGGQIRNYNVIADVGWFWGKHRFLLK